MDLVAKCPLSLILKGHLLFQPNARRYIVMAIMHFIHQGKGSVGKSRSHPQVFIYKNDMNPLFSIALFRNNPLIADPVGTVAIYTASNFLTRVF